MKIIYKKLADLSINLFKSKYVPFISEVEEFNEMMGKGDSNRDEPNIPSRNEWEFVYNFILEELEEYRAACEAGDIVEVADALGDIQYVLCNGILLHGFKTRFVDIYNEIQSSNLSKICMTEEDAIETVKVRSKQQNEPCHFKQIGEGYVVYRTRDNKVMKNIKYFSPNLKQFFTQDELNKFNQKIK